MLLGYRLATHLSLRTDVVAFGAITVGDQAFVDAMNAAVNLR